MLSEKIGFKVSFPKTKVLQVQSRYVDPLADLEAVQRPRFSRFLTPLSEIIQNSDPTAIHLLAVDVLNKQLLIFHQYFLYLPRHNIDLILKKIGMNFCKIPRNFLIIQ